MDGSEKTNYSSHKGSDKNKTQEALECINNARHTRWTGKGIISVCVEDQRAHVSPSLVQCWESRTGKTRRKALELVLLLVNRRRVVVCERDSWSYVSHLPRCTLVTFTSAMLRVRDEGNTAESSSHVRVISSQQATCSWVREGALVIHKSPRHH